MKSFKLEETRTATGDCGRAADAVKDACSDGRGWMLTRKKLRSSQKAIFSGRLDSLHSHDRCDLATKSSERKYKYK